MEYSPVASRRAPVENVLSESGQSWSAAAQRIKALEDGLNAFPVDHPSSAMVSQADPTTCSGDDAEDEGRVKTRPRDASKAVSKSVAPQATAKDATKKAKIEVWLSMAEKSIQKLRSENEALEKIALLLQENSIDNDARYEEALMSLRAQLEFASTFRQDGSEALAVVDERMLRIQECIEQLVSTAERNSSLEHGGLKAAFDKQLEEQRCTLERVRENGKNTTHEWRTKNEEMQRSLEGFLEATQAAYAKNQSLQKESQRLRVEYEAQAGDHEMLERQLQEENKELRGLKDLLRSLEMRLGAQDQRIPSPPQADTATNMIDESLEKKRLGSPTESQAQQADYAVALRRAQILFENEAANLQAVRDTHLRTLRQRTELEVFLRQAILWRKTERQKEYRVPLLKDHKEVEDRLLDHLGTVEVVPSEVLSITDPRPFSQDDRRIVLERLLSQERVLMLLYDAELNADCRRIPNKPPVPFEKLSDPQKVVDAVVNPREAEQQELNDLFERWQRWAAAANEALGAPTVQGR
jgi:hypothetical protein